MNDRAEAVGIDQVECSREVPAGPEIVKYRRGRAPVSTGERRCFHPLCPIEMRLPPDEEILSDGMDVHVDQTLAARQHEAFPFLVSIRGWMGVKLGPDRAS